MHQARQVDVAHAEIEVGDRHPAASIKLHMFSDRTLRLPSLIRKRLTAAASPGYWLFLRIPSVSGFPASAAVRDAKCDRTAIDGTGSEANSSPPGRKGMRGI